jgi:hypothetical protein
MITDLILGWMKSAITALLGLLPTVSVPDIHSGISGLGVLWNGLAWGNQYAPVTEALAMLGILLTAWTAMQLFNVVLWVLTKLHVLGGSS